MVVYHIVIVLYMSMGSHMTQANSINRGGYFVLVYLSVLWIDLKNQTEDYWCPCCTHRAFTNTSINAYEASLPHRICTATHALKIIMIQTKIASHLCLLPVRLLRHSLGVKITFKPHLFSPNSTHLKSRGSDFRSYTWFDSMRCLKHVEKKKKNQKTNFSHISVPSMRFVFSAVLSIAEKTHKKTKTKRKKTKKNLTSTDRVFCLYVFGLYVFGFYINCTVQSWEKGETKKRLKDKDILGISFSVYVVPVTAGTVSGILALSKSLELCSSSHCSILKKHFSGFLNDGSKVCLI